MKWFWRKEISEPEAETIQTNDLQRMLKYGKASDTIGEFTSKAFIELPYGLVKIRIPKLLSEGETEAAVGSIMQSQFVNFDIQNATGNEIVGFFLWVQQQMEHLAYIEKTFLSSDPEPEMLAAGIMKLNEFGEMATIDQLAKGNILEYEKIEALPYFQVYQKLKLDKAHREIEKKYSKIMADKAKRK